MDSVQDIRTMAHGVCMAFAWAFFAIFATMISRYVPKKYAWWFWAHLGMAVIALILSILGFGLSQFMAKGISTTSGVHGTFGAIVLIVAIGQVVLGVFIDQLWRYRHRKTGLIPSTTIFGTFR